MRRKCCREVRPKPRRPPCECRSCEGGIAGAPGVTAIYPCWYCNKDLAYRCTSSGHESWYQVLTELGCTELVRFGPNGWSGKKP